MRTASEVRKIRDSRTWRNSVRPAKLARDPICEKCIKKDKLHEATQVDHIIPLEQDGDPFSPSNLMSLCGPCHVKKTSEENRQRNLAKSINGKTLT